MCGVNANAGGRLCGTNIESIESSVESSDFMESIESSQSIEPIESTEL